MNVENNGRRELLERLGAFYGEQRFALVWTDTNRARDADDDRPKRVTTKAWQTTLPLPHAARGKALMRSWGQSKNPGINLRTSRLVGIECDGEEDLLAVEALGLPPTLTERSSKPYKRHFYFRPPDELETLPSVSFRFEGGKVTSVGNNYYVCAPAIHPSGVTYEYLPGLGPGEVEIATMPADTYWALVALAEKADAEQRQRLQAEPGAKILEGQRRDTIFRYACAQRRWTSSEAVILAACLSYNEAHCHPPLTREQVEGQIPGAMQYPAGTALPRPAAGDDIDLSPKVSQASETPETPAPVPFEITVRTTREVCELPPPNGADRILGPLIRRGDRTVVGGHTGEGKTTLVAWMMAAVVDQATFLDWTGAGGKALVLDLEQGLRSVQRMLWEVGLDDSDDVHYALIPEGLALDKNSAQADAIEELLQTNGYDVVVLDPYYKAHTGDSNDERQVDDLMRLLDLWRSRYGFALILPAHCRKPQPSAPGAFTIHDIFGSSAFLRGAEIVLGLRRVSDGYSRLHFFKDRDGDLPVPEAWGLIFERETGFRRDPNDGKTRDLRAELLELEALTDWRTMSEIRVKKDSGGVGADKDKIRPVLDDLVSEGLFEYQVGPPGRASNAKCWRVAWPSDATHATDLFSGLPGDMDAVGGVVASLYIDDTKTPPPATPRTDSGEGGVEGDATPGPEDAEERP